MNLITATHLVCANAVDFYLAEERHEEKSKIIELALADDPEDNPTVMGYIREAQSENLPVQI
jgi:hypothetical protein